MFGLLKRFWVWFNAPSLYDIWSKAFDKLQAEKKMNGRGSRYWEIWYKEVCPAYRELTEKTPKFLRHPLTDDILDDMEKPVSQWRHF